uniref:ABC2_membrane_7 domain-containing protein n=1 Tax=Haemonchus contortus TaxID=6289 RepID=A0A7I4YZG3_HAECO
QGGAVVRDCWSRVIGEDGPFALDPRALRDVVKLSEDGDGERILGLIYTCRGFLCNVSPSTFHFAQLIALPLLSIFIGYLTL